MKVIPILVTVFAACAAQAKNIEVLMRNNGKDGLMVFEPGFIQASVGDTVTFVPADPTHNSSSLLVPAGAKAWAGQPDQKISVTLDKEGIYLFKCDPHLAMAMVGVIQVGSAGNLAEAKLKADAAAKTFTMNKDRFTKYLGMVK